MILRKITIIVVMMNSGAVLLNSMGMPEVVGVEFELGASQAVTELSNEMEEVASGDAGVGDGIVALATGGIDIFLSLPEVILAAPIMVQNLGVPAEITAFIFAPIYIAAAIDIGMLMRGLNP